MVEDGKLIYALSGCTAWHTVKTAWLQPSGATWCLEQSMHTYRVSFEFKRLELHTCRNTFACIMQAVFLCLSLLTNVHDF